MTVALPQESDDSAGDTTWIGGYDCASASEKHTLKQQMTPHRKRCLYGQSIVDDQDKADPGGLICILRRGWGRTAMEGRLIINGAQRAHDDT